MRTCNTAALVRLAVVGVSLLVLAFSLAFTIKGLRLATVDDLAVGEAFADASQAAELRLYDFRIGRFYADVKFTLLEGLLGIRSDWLNALIKLSCFLACLGSAAYFAWKIKGKLHAPVLVLLLGLAFMPVAVAYQPLVSMPTLFVGWAAVWLMGAFSLSEEGPVTRCLIVASFGLSLMVHEANMVFIVLPVLVRWADGRASWLRSSIRVLALCLVVAVVYCVCFASLRWYANLLHSGEAYQGAVLSFHPSSFARAVLLYSWSGFPAVESWLLRWDPLPAGMLIGPSAWLARVSCWAGALGVACSLALSLSSWVLASAAPKDPAPDTRRILRFLAVLLFICHASNLILSLTAKYQLWAYQRMWPYYQSWMSYVSWILIVVLVLLWLSARQAASFRHLALRAFLVLCLGLLTLGSVASNRLAVAFLGRHPLSHLHDYNPTIGAEPRSP